MEAARNSVKLFLFVLDSRTYAGCGHNPAGKSHAGGIAVFGIENFEELFFQGIGCQQTAAGIEHKVNLLFLLRSKKFVSLIQQEPRALKVNSSGFAELFLFFLSNGFKSPEK
jgi:hypothetical protein